MKTLLLTLVLAQSVSLLSAQMNPNDHWVEGYYQQDGTYVPGHYQTDPNSTINDNFSTYPNINPYTGQQGQIRPSTDNSTITSPDGTFRVASYGQVPVQQWGDQLRRQRAARQQMSPADRQRLEQHRQQVRTQRRAHMYQRRVQEERKRIVRRETRIEKKNARMSKKAARDYAVAQKRAAKEYGTKSPAAP